MNLGFAVHNFDAADGTGGYAVELLPRIARRHEVTLYTANVRAKPPDGVRVVRVPALRGRAYATVLSFPAALSVVRKKHDLLHAQGWVTHTADVVTAHIVLAAWRSAAREAGVPTRLGERLFGRFVVKREAELMTQRSRHVIVPSEKARNDLARSYGRTHGVTVIHHGFPAACEGPPSAVARERLRMPTTEFVALFAGDVHKGLGIALDAIARTDGVHLLVVTRSAAGSYVSQSRKLGIEERVHWAGALEDMAIAYAAADVLLHPSIYDTFGMVAAEAMATGLPTIVSPQAGVSELIEHGRSGWVLEANTAANAADALIRLSQEPGLRVRMGNNARATASRRGWDRAADDTLRVYERVLAQQ